MLPKLAYGMQQATIVHWLLSRWKILRQSQHRGILPERGRPGGPPRTSLADLNVVNTANRSWCFNLL